MDLPLDPVDDEKADPTWDADGSHWSTSSDDEEESVTAFDDLPRVSGTGSLARATQFQVELSNRPHLALFNKAPGAPKMEARVKIKNEPLQPIWAESSDSDDSSLASIPAIARIKETPVPLPPTVAAAGLLTASVSSQPRPAVVPPTTPRAPASTPTPVPLPSTVMRNASAPQVPGQTSSRSAPAAGLPDSRKPAATSSTPSSGLAETLHLPFTNEKIEPTLSYGAPSTAKPRKRYPVAMEIATDRRPYTVFVQPNGKQVPTKGVLIPAGYRLHSDPNLPFICPVRGCQRRFKNLIALSGHFGSCHSNMTFNDNGDGTMSKFGTYRNRSGSSPGIVVAQVPVPRTTLPAFKRGLGEHGTGPSKRQLEESDAGQDRKRRAMSENREHNQTTQFERDVSKYMAEVHSGFRTANRLDISRMLRLPRKRDLPKEFLDKHTYTDLAAQTYACAIAYVVGDEVSGRSACHAATGPLACLSEQCIVLPKSIQLDPKIVRIFTPHHRCIGCAYLALMTSAPDQCELRTEPSKAGSGDRVVPTSSAPDQRELRTEPSKAGSGDRVVLTSSGRPLPDVPTLRPLQPAPQQEQQSSPVLSGWDTEQTLNRRHVRQSVLNRLRMDKDQAARPQSKLPAEQPGAQLSRLGLSKDQAAKPQSKSPSEEPSAQVNRLQTDKDQAARSQSKSPSEQHSAHLDRLQADMDQAARPQRKSPSEQPGTQLNQLQTRSQSKSPSEQPGTQLNQLQTDKDQAARSQSKSPSEQHSAHLDRLQADMDQAARPQRKSPSEQHSSTRLERGILPIKHQGQFGTPEYEMEDWEIAPGRVTNEDSSRNIAYSGTFLTSSTPITISHDIDFNILTIRPGQIYNVPAQKGKIQVFSVASGKLRVTTGGKVVQLGPNGVFPVRPGEKCVIENRIYFEAMVHCTTVKDYELA